MIEMSDTININTQKCEEWKERTELLFADGAMARLASAHVLVVGLGGVGGIASEMIARAGVGAMTIVDADSVSPTNINRQLLALHSTVGESKARILERRLKDINPKIKLTVVEEFIKDDRTDELLDSAKFDYVADCIDTLSPKVNLIVGALERGYPLVSSMGAGAKVDPLAVEIKDIGKTHHCPLAHMLRKRLHRQGIRKGFRAVFSAEPLIAGSMILCDEQNKKSNVGTISYMPSVFGCAVASEVIRNLCSDFISYE